MSRVTLDDGRWFDSDRAEKFDEELEWNGHNRISIATGSQWEHETLYRTAGGRWVLYHWSQWQGSRDTYEEASNNEAARWLARNGHSAHASCEVEFAALEIA